MLFKLYQVHNREISLSLLAREQQNYSLSKLIVYQFGGEKKIPESP